jgi:predicted TPR repeat methyltransferase
VSRGFHNVFRSSGDLLADRRYAHARELEARGDLEAAVDLLAQAIELAPRFASAWFALGAVQERLKNREEAVRAFQAAKDMDPDDELGAKLRLARLGAADMPAMSPAYIRSLFDQYAPQFDDALLNGLEYRGHSLLAKAIRAAAPSRRFRNALDLGCGTGLAAQALREDVDAFTGVDLSPEMIAQSRTKGIYQELIVADIATYLNGAAPARYDLVIAADALVYVHDLAEICLQVRRALQTGGLFALTLETHDGAGVILGDKLRYAHGSQYVTDVMAYAQLNVLEHGFVSTRWEGGLPVPGLLVVAQAPYA